MKPKLTTIIGAMTLWFFVTAGPAFAAVITFTNPTPAVSDFFGNAVAAVGTDKVLIAANYDDTGASDAGAVYLYSTNGTLLTTFTNPTPAASDLFGNAVAAVGTDRVLIGAYRDDTGAADAGAAYLFSTGGALLTTFTNPTPAASELFGSAVVAVGTNRVFIGAAWDAACLFSTSGTLLTTFANPAPSGGFDRFGTAAAALGTDRVLIGAYLNDTGATDAGVAYLFNTNGTLLTTFTNPTPAASDWFGRAVAAVGTDKVLISAYADDTGATDAGAAYLFSTNGTLLTTFTNPTPAASDWFGCAVTAVGADQVLIGAYQDDTATINAGAAYLFSLNGTLLTNFTKPNPANYDSFGNAVAAVGADQVLIGAFQDDTGAGDAGAAYLFSFPSANANLAGLLLSAGTLTPAFDPAVTNYTASVLNSIANLAVTATSADTNATLQVRVNGGAFSNVLSGLTSPPLPLNFGTNSLDVRVTAQDLTTIKTYTVAMTRLVNQPPVANAGADRNAYTGQTITLLGSATDPDGDAIIAWAWVVDQAPAGRNWTLAPNTAQFPSFTAYAPGDYVILLIVADDFELGSSPDFVTVHVANNQPPVAVATADKTTISVGDTVCFDGSQSSDPEGRPLSSRWDFRDGSPLLYEIAPCHRFDSTGTFDVSLLVVDERSAADLDVITITVLPPLPKLRIELPDPNTVLLAWPVAATGYDLQQNADLATTNWLAVTNAPEVVGSEKQVIINPPTGNRFYRLNKP